MSRRQPWCWSGRAALLLLLALGTAAAPHPARGAEPAVEEVGAVGMTVADLERSVRFYREVLGFEPVAEVEVSGEGFEHLSGVFGARARIATLALGSERLELTQYLAPEGRAIPAEWRSNDRWFQHVAIIVRDMDLAYRTLREHRVRHASSGPQRLPDWNKAAGGIQAFYFKDPDGHVLEVLQFPPGKGQARWHARTDKLFLGIDHTAIVVGDTEQSLGFYRDQLGMVVAGEAENYGTEQEHLNNVFGARLRITALRAARGPAIELLEYLAPRDGRPFPPDTRAADLWHWQTHLQSSDAARAERLYRTAHRTFVSPGLVDTARLPLGARRGFLGRDPDGHALLFEEPAAPRAEGPRGPR